MTTTPAERYAVRCQELGDALRFIRNAAGLSQSEVARRLGIHRTTLGKYEHGSTAQPIDLRRQFVRAIADIALERRAATR